MFKTFLNILEKSVGQHFILTYIFFAILSENYSEKNLKYFKTYCRRTGILLNSEKILLSFKHFLSNCVSSLLILIQKSYLNMSILDRIIQQYIHISTFLLQRTLCNQYISTLSTAIMTIYITISSGNFEHLYF